MGVQNDRGDPLEWSDIIAMLGILLMTLAFAGAARMLRSEREAVAAVQARAPARVAAAAVPMAARPAPALIEAWIRHAQTGALPR
jgi:hypothetical protein